MLLESFLTFFFRVIRCFLKPYFAQNNSNDNSQDLRKLSRPHFKNKMRHYLFQILEQEEDYFGIPTIMSHLQKII